MVNKINPYINYIPLRNKQLKIEDIVKKLNLSAPKNALNLVKRITSLIKNKKPTINTEEIKNIFLEKGFKISTNIKKKPDTTNEKEYAKYIIERFFYFLYFHGIIDPSVYELISDWMRRFGDKKIK